MANPELGTKRVCPVTGRKFYDLNRNPIISPYTGQVVTIAAPVIRGARPEVLAARPAPAASEDELEATSDVELVSLEDADEEAGGAKPAAAEDDLEIEDETTSEDDTFLAEEEEEDDDVTDLIGDGLEDDEEP